MGKKVSVPKIAKIVAFGKWEPKPNDSAIDIKADEIEHFFVASLVAIHALKESSKLYVVETIFGGDELAFDSALLKIAEIQIKDDLDDDKAMPEAIRSKACEIGEVDWVNDDEYFQREDVLEELNTLKKELFPNGAEGENLDELAAWFSGEMGSYFDKVCFSPRVILEAYVERINSIKTKS
ncbi:MAG: hypothetical protein ACJAWS_002274 [Oleiphilaceae bacterium]